MSRPLAPAWRRELSRFSGAVLLGALLLNVRADPVPSSRSPEGWQRAIGTWAWQFPRDHGAHPDFKTEWWYFTGNLEDAAHRPFGYELTIFRQGIQKEPAQKTSQWAVRDIYFGHLAITDIAAQKFYSAERVSRGALGEAFTRTRHMEVKLGPWEIAQDQGNETINLAAQTDTLDLRLQARPSQPLILEGVAGLSQKSKEPGQASFYYSYPRLATAGALTVDGRTYQVVGQSWFDHEFSTSSLAADQVGWDWFCLQLDNREDVMLYVMRRADGSIDPTSEGTWVRADGTSERLPPGSFTVQATNHWTSAVTHATYPSGWTLSIPSHQASFDVQPRELDQELRLGQLTQLAYWEGACTIRGTQAGKAATGVGYTELTGYAGPLQGGLK